MKIRRWSAWFLLLSDLVLFVITLILTLLPLPTWPGAIEFVGTFFFPAVMLLFVIVGALIVLRHTDNLIGWLLIATGMINHLSTFGKAYALYGALPAAAVGAWMYGWMELVAIGLMWLAFLHFPDGRLLSQRWQWVRTALICAIGLVGVVAVLLWPHRHNPALMGIFEKEVGFEAAAVVLRIAQFVLFPSTVAVAVSILLRFRRATGIARQQIKWLLYAGSILAAGGLTFLVTGTGPEHPDAPLIGVLLAALGLIGIPVAIGIAILRYRLYDIDLIIRRTLQYSILTGLLALVFFGSVTLLQSIVSAVSGQQSALATVLSTLAIAALFNPLRRRVQEVIDRRFYRRKYDAQQVLARFAVTARDETDLDKLAEELQRVVGETMQPEGAGVWLQKP
ncbi:MAG: hypothetical protein HY328_18800 [Chloroflexi bacterium]|nr:hypothetical protein [Chloroflexota bacterium]